MAPHILMFLALGGWAAETSAQTLDLGFLRTRAEVTSYQETTGYDEAVGFLEVAAAQSADIHLTHFGYSFEGRPLPLIVWGTPDADPETVINDSRLRVFVQANIHAGEVCGKEAMLAMVRDLAAGHYTAWRDSVVLLIAPIYNADGNERVTLFNRPRQNGPLGGMGQRPNAQGLDLNRDHMKMASPEARSLVSLMNDYDPHVLVDLHTTNGSRHGYHLTYSPPLNPNTHPAIDALLRESLLPEVTSRIRDSHGWEFYYYGNLPFRGGDRGWYTFDHRPRFNNNYVGLRNRVAILSEAYSYASFEERVLSTRAFVEEIVTYAAANASTIQAVVDAADADSISGRPFAVRSRFKRSKEPVEILLGEVSRERNPYSGASVLVRTDETRVEEMYEYGAFESAEAVTLPVAYLIPESMQNVVTMLEDHGVQAFETDTASIIHVEEFVIDSTRVAERAFQGVNERTLFGSFRERETEVPRGTWLIPTDQPLGRLAAYLLEPRSDDGLVNWGRLDETVSTAEIYPILRIPAADEK